MFLHTGDCRIALALASEMAPTISIHPRMKISDSDGFCGFQKMLKGVDFQSLRLCAFALSFYSLTQRRG
ncbi:MAG: hypothetical protein ACXQTY_06935, partial [Candidatus Methanogasteraceae archaeon]